MSFQPLTKDKLQDALTACEQFEADLSAFVDGELSALDASRVSGHVGSCTGCRSFVQGLAELSDWHSFSAEEDAPAAAADSVDAAISQIGAAPLWSGLVKRLLDDTQERLADVLYELGKALIAAGHRTTAEIRQVSIFQKRPGSISSLSRKGKMLAREFGELSEQSSECGASAASKQRTRGPRRHELRKTRLFPSTEQEAGGSAAFHAGRRCLEQALKLDPRCHNARIFLADYHKVMGRLDRARQQLRILLRSDADRRTKMIARHHMSRVYSSARQFARAVELEQGVLEEAAKTNDRFFQAIALTNLTIYSAKLDRLEDAEASISRLVREFPSQLSSVVVPAFQKAHEFKRVLAKNAPFLAGLRQRYPAVFCS